MHGQRLQWLAVVGLAAAVPEALVRAEDQQVAFQSMLVVQLLGVIVAAIGVAAACSVLGLGLVRLATRPWMDHAPTFVAWSFLRAPRLHRPWPLALAASVRAAVDAGGASPVRSSWRKLALAAVCGGVAVAGLAWSLAQAPTVASLAVRNLAVAMGLHGALLALAALPWKVLRLAVVWTVVAVGVVIAALLLRHPALMAWADPSVLVLAAALFLAGGVMRAGPETGLAQRLARRGAHLGWMAAALLAAGWWLRSSAVVASAVLLALGLAALLVALYLLLQGQAKVSLPVFVAIVGVASGTWALIVVLSVMGGFAADLRAKMLVANAHVLVEAPGRAQPFAHAARLAAALRALPAVAAASPQIRGDAIVSSSFNIHNFVSIRGIDPTLPEVERELGATLRSGGLALLRQPGAWGQDRSLRRRSTEQPADLPPAEGATATDSPAADDSDALLKALGTLPPGPATAEPPQPAGAARPVLLAPSGGGTVSTPTAVRQAPVAAPAEELGTEPIDGGGRGAAADLPQLEPSLPRADDDPADEAPEPVDVPLQPGLLIGVELARSLQVEVGDKVEVITPDGDIGPTGLRPRVRSFRVAGTFETGLYEADSKVAYMTLDEAARYFNLAGEANVLELRLREPENPDAAVAQIRATLQRLDSGGLEVIDWRQLNRSLFSALAFERLVIFLVLALIILVAAFAIVSALTMVILQKHDSIAMLRAMGSSASAIRSAFVQMGGVIGLIGTTAGTALGLGTCLLIETLGIQLPEAYYVRTLPVRLLPSEVAVVVLASVGISLLATIVPARSAARLQPLEGLRHG